MRREGLQNARIQQVIAGLGHPQRIVICAVGLPIPAGVETIDLAVENGLPGFIDVLRPIARELVYEKYVYAQEMAVASGELLEEMRSLLGNVAAEAVPHEQFKEMIRDARAIIRTGSCTPYSNVLLVGGVNF